MSSLPNPRGGEAGSPAAIIGDPARAKAEWGQPSLRSLLLSDCATLLIPQFVAGQGGSAQAKNGA